MTDTKAGSRDTEPWLSAPAERFGSGQSHWHPPAVGTGSISHPTPLGFISAGGNKRCANKGFISLGIGERGDC